ncbi:MAG: ribosomal protein S18-alanine N-acetyltransferase [Actinomycetia bacterium]|nr:ribosomal protein S18-alanine N-acetyltransferase [Actinomycetes bacterium]
MTRIKKMNIEDIDKVLEIEEESFPNPWTKRMLIDELTRKNRFYITLFFEGEIIGYAGFYYVFGEGHITTLAVSSKYRGRGYAKEMIKLIIIKAGELGLSELTLEVRRSNNRAQILYSQFGFKDMGLRKDYYYKPLENGLIMTLKLGEKTRLRSLLNFFKQKQGAKGGKKINLSK